MTVSCEVAYDAGDVLIALLWRPSLPDGWSVTGVSGDGNPEYMGGDFVFLGDLTPNPLSFSYTVAFPMGQAGEKAVGGTVEHMQLGMIDAATTNAMPDPLALRELRRLKVYTQWGATDPAGTNLYVDGSAVTCRVDAPVVSGGTGVQYVCTGWQSTGVTPGVGVGASTVFVMTNDATLSWLWQTQYWFEAEAQAGGQVSASNGWYAAGSTATATATALSGFHFSHWIGDVPSGSETTTPLAVAMDRPRAVEARYAVDTNSVVVSHDCAGYYSPGSGTLVTCSFQIPGDQGLASFSWTPELPDGWVLLAAMGDGGATVTGNTIEFPSVNPTNPVQFSYTFAVPGNEAVTSTLSGGVSFRFDGMSAERSLTVPDLETARYHSADFRGPSWSVDGTEINRALAYWRSSGYHATSLGLDGFAPTDSPDTNVLDVGRHSADYKTSYWILDDDEINRVLAYWRGGGYRVDPAGIDGYSPIEPLHAPPPGFPAPPPVQVEIGQQGDAHYDPGGLLTVTNTVSFGGELLSVGWQFSIPEGWVVVDVDGDGGPESSCAGEIVWTDRRLESPLTMSYTVRVPEWERGEKAVLGWAALHFRGQSNPVHYMPGEPIMVVTPRDGDGDGLPDAWENRYAGGLTNALPDADGDGDGLTNLEEYQAGTNPMDAQSFFGLTAIRRDPDGSVELAWQSVTGRVYAIERSETALGLYTPLLSGIPADPPTNSIAAGISASESQFYRVSIQSTE